MLAELSRTAKFLPKMRFDHCPHSCAAILIGSKKKQQSKYCLPAQTKRLSLLMLSLRRQSSRLPKLYRIPMPWPEHELQTLSQSNGRDRRSFGILECAPLASEPPCKSNTTKVTAVRTTDQSEIQASLHGYQLTRSERLQVKTKKTFIPRSKPRAVLRLQRPT